MMIKKFLFGAMPESDSTSGNFNALDLKKSLRHTTVVAIGAVATIFLNAVAQYASGLDIGKYQFILAFVLSSGIVEVLRRFIATKLPQD